MSDEQTELLRQILEVQKEQLAFAKRQDERIMSLQTTAVEGQRKGLRRSRFVIAFMVIAVGLIVFLFLLGTPEPKPGDDIPAHKSPAAPGNMISD